MCDKERLKTYKKYGYKTLIIWEHELVKNKFGRLLSNNEILGKIREFIKT